MILRCWFASCLVAVLLGSSLFAQPRYWQGQTISPAFEGWERNLDGTFNLYFGYFNRNWEETLEIPVGPDNRVDPGGDRGQPTHFLTSRRKQVFAVVVPADFAHDRLTWTLSHRGHTEVAVGTIDPIWEIDTQQDRRTGNRRPVATVLAPETVEVSSAARLEITAEDDGLPGSGLVVEWDKYRGPGSVTFHPRRTQINGATEVEARFSAPGTYVLQAVVDDGSRRNYGFTCCWKTTLTSVTVVYSGQRVMPPPEREDVTFSRDVAPIFYRRCVHCHRDGDRGPMPLVAYEQARPWASAIKRRVAAREMPPWHIDNTVGIRAYKNDPSLTDREIDIIVKWVDGGAPQGDPADLPPPPTFPSKDEWAIGTPDLVVTFERDHTMYASGPDWWIDYFVDSGLAEDRYLKAMEIKPGNPAIVHHAVVSLVQGDNPDPQGTLLTEYSIGKGGEVLAPDTGRLIKAGARLRFGMHYHPVGAEATDRTKVGFVFFPKGTVPKYEVVPVPIRNLPNAALDVPPHSVVRHDAYFRLPQHARIDAFQPHMHARGKSMLLEAIHLNNTTEVLTSVNHYDFNWQVAYAYEEHAAPLLPAGTVLHVMAIHDNTASNPRNPDPARWVPFGERSIDEMMQAWVSVIYLDEGQYRAEVAARERAVR